MNGWMAHLSFSRMFQTSNTVVTLSGYRYSTEGYRDLSDVIGLRAVGAAQWNSATYMQRNRFHINVNQPLGKWGSMYVAASTGSYRNGRSDDNNLQLGYSKSFGNGVSVNFALARQRIGASQTNNPIPAPMLGDARENTAMLSVSFPLDGSALARPGHVAVSAVHSANRGEQVQATYSGVQAHDDSLSYSVTASHGNDGSKSSLAANAQKRFNNATLGVNASRGSGYWQLGASTQGAAVVHSGGLTLGPYLGETAALVEAVGAEGARVWGGVSGRVNDNGFVLVPSVIPYRYNNITLDPQGMTGDFDLLASEQRVAPYAGSLVRLKYQTRAGGQC
ncbi:fimbrial biogenesis outer membrane usher protein [Diaphorobacter aerolatus]|uniref:Fimbrial biogenesis outer membrane usher protein n=1 Tax=Diaphorobacter aerolatus TaxID=1288495 RepID=A0A7H0GQX6_9BURK|nr:fimbrial biogenesis outer membrane usher protein [Diaphorobacter aerolatus]